MNQYYSKKSAILLLLLGFIFLFQLINHHNNDIVDDINDTHLRRLQTNSQPKRLDLEFPVKSNIGKPPESENINTATISKDDAKNEESEEPQKEVKIIAKIPMMGTTTSSNKDEVEVPRTVEAITDVNQKSNESTNVVASQSKESTVEQSSNMQSQPALQETTTSENDSTIQSTQEKATLSTGDTRDNVVNTSAEQPPSNSNPNNANESSNTIANKVEQSPLNAPQTPVLTETAPIPNDNIVQQTPTNEISNTNEQQRKPHIYTYITEEEYTDQELLNLWIESWKAAGYETIVLNEENAKLHVLYNEFDKLLKEKNICCLPRQSFIRFLAMGTVVENDINYFSEVYVLPLHKASNKVMEDGLTYYDGFTGSVISGSPNDFNLLIPSLASNIEKNSALSHKKIFELSRGIIPTAPEQERLIAKVKNVFHYKNEEFLENIRYFNQDVCLRSESKFFLRMHPNEVIKHNVAYLPTSYRAFMIRNWFNFYRNLCWNHHSLNGIVPKQLANNTFQEFDANSYERPVIDEGSTETQVTCDAVSCHIRDACVGRDGVIQIFGSEEHVKKEQEKLVGKITHAWVCQGCRREIKTERGTSFHNIWAHTATMSTGIDHNNCGFHLGDVIWPLVRLNAKFRDVQDIVHNDGLGYLFLESPASHCDSLYTAVSQQATRYQTIQNNVCFNNIYVGAYHMNYMITSPNSFFVPYDNFNRDMRLMRSLFYNSFGIDDSNLPALDTILIMRKRKGRKDMRSLLYHNIANIPEIVTMVKEKFPKYNVQIVSWEDYSIMQQVRIMARTKLIISLPGAAIMNAFLFQNDASLFCYCQRDDNVSADSSSVYINGIKFQQSNEYKLWFDHFDYGHFYQICQEPDMYLSGSDTVVNVDVLEKKMIDIGM